MAPFEEGNGFGEYRRLILDGQRRLEREIERINRKMDEVRVDDLSRIKGDIALLKYKAGLWGSIAGSVAGTVFGAGLTFLTKLFFH